MRTPRLRAVALCGALALAGTACSTKGGSDSADKPKATTTTAKATTTTEEVTTTTEEATTTTEADGPSEDQLITFVKPLLLTSSDLGSDTFEAQELSDTEETCGVDFDKEYPNKARVGTQLESASLKLAFQEIVRVYATEGEAADGYQAVVDKALACGELGGGNTISAGEDVSSDVSPDGADVEATGYSVSGDTVEGVVVVAHFSDAIVVFQFAGAKGAADAAGAPNPVDVVKAGLQKIVDGLPGN